MDKEVSSNLIAIDSLFSVIIFRSYNSKMAVSQINLSIDQRYRSISNWLDECVLLICRELTD